MLIVDIVNNIKERERDSKIYFNYFNSNDSEKIISSISKKLY